MERTTVMAPPELMDELRAIAEREGVPLAQVIRAGLELRARQSREYGFIGLARSGSPTSDDPMYREMFTEPPTPETIEHYRKLAGDA